MLVSPQKRWKWMVKRSNVSLLSCSAIRFLIFFRSTLTPSPISKSLLQSSSEIKLQSQIHTHTHMCIQWYRWNDIGFPIAPPTSATVTKIAVQKRRRKKTGEEGKEETTKDLQFAFSQGAKHNVVKMRWEGMNMNRVKIKKKMPGIKEVSLSHTQQHRSSQNDARPARATPWSVPLVRLRETNEMKEKRRAMKIARNTDQHTDTPSLC